MEKFDILSVPPGLDTQTNAPLWANIKDMLLEQFTFFSMWALTFIYFCSFIMKLFWFSLPLAQLYKLRNAYLKHRQHIFAENCRFQLIKFLYECIFNVHFWRKIADLGLLYSFMNVYENVQQHSVSLVCSGAKHKACNHSFLEIKDFKVPKLDYISLYFLEKKIFDHSFRPSSCSELSFCFFLFLLFIWLPIIPISRSTKTTQYFWLEFSLHKTKGKRRDKNPLLKGVFT